MTWLKKYREEIQAGRVLAGDCMKTELDNLVSDLDNPGYIYDTADADLRIDFIENCVRLTKSPYYGKPMKLMLWEKAFIETLYSFKVRSFDSGELVNRFQEALLLIARKNGKTELVAALLLAEMLLGLPGADIVCSGTDDGTADLAYQTIDTMRLQIDPKSVDTWRNQKGISCKVNGSHIFKLTEKTRQREGRNVDMAALDEVWSFTEGDIYKIIQQSGSSKDNFRIIMFGSEGFVDGFLDEKRKEYNAIIYGEDDTESASRKLPWIYTQDSEQEVWETNEDGINPAWEKSNPSIGMVKKWSFLRTAVEDARKSKINRVYTLTKDFNIKQGAAAIWLRPEDYLYPAEYELERFRGALCVGAVDLSETTDMTSAKALWTMPGEITKYVYQHYWIPESKLENSDDKNAGAKYREWAKAGLLTICEGNDIDLTLVADWFFEIYKKYGLRLYKCGYDVKFSKEFLRRMEEYGFECEVILQNKLTLSNAMKLCEADLIARRVNFNENPIDIWNLGNAAIEMDNLGNCQVVKQKGQPGKRIDGAVTFIIVYEMFRRYRSEIIKKEVGRYGAF